jgi:NADH:ubiquinone oxidoreductase subunit F (NADH-binding)
MRKRYKNKTKSTCGLCKPHKRGWANRWKVKIYGKLVQAEKDIKEYLAK